MDLWDVAKLMVRRWFVAVPILVLTLVATLLAATLVEPDYTATTNVSLLPPVAQNTSGNGQKVNPWTTDSLSVVTLAHLNSKRLHDELGRTGFSSVWEANTDIRSASLIIIKVTAPTEEEAQATATELQRRVTSYVAEQQASYPLSEEQKITTIPVGLADLEVATGKVKRTLIVVVGIGVILSIALTVSTDALLRWRASRKGRAADGTDPAASGSTPAAGRTAPGQPGASRVWTAGTATAAPSGSAQQPLLGAAGVKYELTVATDPANGGRPALVAIPVEPQPADDATVVLPLSNGPWAGKGLKRTDPSGKAAGNVKR